MVIIEINLTKLPLQRTYFHLWFASSVWEWLNFYFDCETLIWSARLAGIVRVFFIHKLYTIWKQISFLHLSFFLSFFFSFFLFSLPSNREKFGQNVNAKKLKVHQFKARSSKINIFVYDSVLWLLKLVGHFFMISFLLLSIWSSGSKR